MNILFFILYSLNFINFPNDEKWNVYTSKDKIPQTLIKSLNNLTKERVRFCNPNEEFQATDLMTKRNLSKRQLIFTAQRKDNWILVYNHAGRGSHQHFVECTIISNKILNLKIGSPKQNIANFSDAQRLMESNEFDFNYVEL